MSQELLKTIDKIEEILSGHAAKYPSKQVQDLKRSLQKLRSDHIEDQGRNTELRRRLEEAEQALDAIRNGEVDAIVRSDEDGAKVYTLEGPDRPYQKIVETMNAGAVTVDHSGIVFYSNSAFAKMTGIPLENLIGSSFKDLILPEDLPLFLDFVAATPGKTTAEIGLKSSKGNLFVRLVRSLTDYDRERTCIVITDISDLKSAEESLRMARDELEEKVERRTAELAREKDALRDEISEREQIEEALRKSGARLKTSEETLRLAIDSTDLGIWDYYPRTGRLDWSDNVKRQFGLPLDARVDFDVFLSGIHPEDREKVLDYTRKVLIPGSDQEHYFEYRTKGIQDGQVRWIAAWVKAYFLETGQPERLIGTTLDITEQKKSEEALRQSEARLRRFFDSGMLGVFYWSEDRITEANDKFLTMVGYSREDLEAGIMKWPDMTPVEYRPLDEYSLGEVTASGVDTPYEKEFVRKDGSRIPIIIGAASLDDPDDEGVAFVLDITDRKLLEENLRRSHDELERRVQERTVELKRQAELLDVAHDAIMVRNLKNEVLWWNHGAEQMYGYSKDEAAGKHAPTLLQCKYPVLLDQIVSTVKAEGHWEGEVTRTTKDGREIVVLSRWALQRDEEGSPFAIMDMGLDITEHKHMEEQLRQVQKMEAIGTLAGGIAHDFNNMLAVILGNAELALDDIDDNETAAHNLEQIMQASKRARDLVKQILTFSRKTDTGKKTLRLTPLVKETCKLLRGTLPSTIQMDLSIDTSSDTVIADPSQIQQVLMNLATNAAHAMRESGGALTIKIGDTTLRRDFLPVKAMKPGTYLTLSVQDNGVGMTDEVLQRAFDPFFTTKQAGEGTGMGLAVVYGIVISHGGAITATSEPGKGSTFTVFLPKAKEKAKEEVKESGVSPSGSERILLIDDEPTVVEMTSSILKRLGYDVTALVSPSEALTLFEADPHRFDLVISDQTMPEISGLALAQEILKERKDIPIILITGYSEVVSPEKAKEAGIAEFVMKPVVKKEIAETIRRVLDDRVQSKPA